MAIDTKKQTTATKTRLAPGHYPALERFLSKLRKVRRSGKGYEALCPGHEERTPSLSVAIGYTGKIVFYCHAGCSPRDVLDAMGLNWSDLRTDTEDRKKEGRLL